ncbi:MAG: GrdB-related putative oxidoreductase [Anaerorhabdus sp.]
MKILLVFDQGLAGAGGKSNPNIELTAVKGGVGSALMLEPHLAKKNIEILATLYCGNQYFTEHQDEVVNKMSAMAKKLNPDYVVCGPCFDFKEFAKMSAMVATSIANKTEIKACAMMAEQNQEIIDEYKNRIPIVKMPKKGGTGLNDSLINLCDLIEKSTEIEQYNELKDKVCY